MYHVVFVFFQVWLNPAYTHIRFLAIIFTLLFKSAYSRLPNNRSPPPPIVNLLKIFHPGHCYSNPPYY